LTRLVSSIKIASGNEEEMVINFERLSKYTWSVLVYNLFVIVWGGYVRASGSGAGCGSHWPLCNGVVVPREPAIGTIIEFTHRITSGATVILVIILCVWVWRKFPRGYALRWTSGASVFFIFTESLIGAGLVLFRLVENDDSIARAVSMMAHLVNTLLLLAALALTAWFLTFGAPRKYHPGRTMFLAFVVGAIGMFVLGASGAVTALGDTLFPVATVAEGIRREFAGTAHYLLRLRILHPPIAIIVGIYVASYGWRLQKQRPSSHATKLSIVLIVLVATQFGLGILNIWLLAPIWLQLVHLLMTTLIWIAYILTSVSGLVSSNFSPRVGQEYVQNGVKQPAA
jgi:heme A synthase